MEELHPLRDPPKTKGDENNVSKQAGRKSKSIWDRTKGLLSCSSCRGNAIDAEPTDTAGLARVDEPLWSGDNVDSSMKSTAATLLEHGEEGDLNFLPETSLEEVALDGLQSAKGFEDTIDDWLSEKNSSEGGGFDSLTLEILDANEEGEIGNGFSIQEFVASQMVSVNEKLLVQKVVGEGENSVVYNKDLQLGKSIAEKKANTLDSLEQGPKEKIFPRKDASRTKGEILYCFPTKNPPKGATAKILEDFPAKSTTYNANASMELKYIEVLEENEAKTEDKEESWCLADQEKLEELVEESAKESLEAIVAESHKEYEDSILQAMKFEESIVEELEEHKVVVLESLVAARNNKSEMRSLQAIEVDELAVEEYVEEIFEEIEEDNAFEIEESIVEGFAEAILHEIEGDDAIEIEESIVEEFAEAILDEIEEEHEIVVLESLVAVTDQESELENLQAINLKKSAEQYGEVSLEEEPKDVVVESLVARSNQEFEDRICQPIQFEKSIVEEAISCKLPQQVDHDGTEDVRYEPFPATDLNELDVTPQFFWDTDEVPEALAVFKEAVPGQLVDFLHNVPSEHKTVLNEREANYVNYMLGQDFNESSPEAPQVIEPAISADCQSYQRDKVPAEEFGVIGTRPLQVALELIDEFLLDTECLLEQRLDDVQVTPSSPMQQAGDEVAEAAAMPSEVVERDHDTTEDLAKAAEAAELVLLESSIQAAAGKLERVGRCQGGRPGVLGLRASTIQWPSQEFRQEVADEIIDPMLNQIVQTLEHNRVQNPSMEDLGAPTSLSSPEINRTLSSTDLDTTQSSVEINTTVSSLDMDGTLSSTDMETTVSSTDVNAILPALEIISTEPSIDMNAEPSVDFDSECRFKDTSMMACSTNIDVSTSTMDINTAVRSEEIGTSVHSAEIDSAMDICPSASSLEIITEVSKDIGTVVHSTDMDSITSMEVNPSFSSMDINAAVPSTDIETAVPSEDMDIKIVEPAIEINKPKAARSNMNTSVSSIDLYKSASTMDIASLLASATFVDSEPPPFLPPRRTTASLADVRRSTALNGAGPTTSDWNLPVVVSSNTALLTTGPSSNESLVDVGPSNAAVPTLAWMVGATPSASGLAERAAAAASCSTAAIGPDASKSEEWPDQGKEQHRAARNNNRRYRKRNRRGKK